jgi:hypothetical protein
MTKHSQAKVDELLDYARQMENTPVIHRNGSTTVVYRGRVYGSRRVPAKWTRPAAPAPSP